MLILTRKSDESIIIGDNVTVKVLKIQGGQVHIGIEAPREIPIYREEIYNEIQKGIPPDSNELVVPVTLDPFQPSLAD